jgi:hypothetical protein
LQTLTSRSSVRFRGVAPHYRSPTSATQPAGQDLAAPLAPEINGQYRSAAPLSREVCHGFQKLGAIFRFDLVFNCDRNWSAIGLDVVQQHDGLRPMHGRREVECGSSLEFPSPQQWFAAGHEDLADSQGACFPRDLPHPLRA